MRPSQLIAVALSLLITAVLAQQPSLPDVPGLSLDDNPPCAIPCLLAALNQTHCPLNDQPCLCADVDYINIVEGCVALSCPLKYALQTQNIIWTSCDFPLSNEAPKYKATRIALFIALPTLAMILRITTKFARISTWGWDDYTIIAAYAILVGFFGMHFFLEANGAGRDLWTLNEDQITNFFKGFYAFQMLYHSCIDIIKASILFMYLRIFHLPDEKIRIVLWITQGVNLANGLIFIFLGLFQCTPVSLVWTFWTGEATGKCLPIAKLGLAHVCINIGLDVWMLILPATQIFRMNMAKRKKFAVMFMFGLGLFLTIVSIIRIPAILEFSKQPLNPTVAMMPSVIWSDIELYVGIFTACIPNMRQFFVSFVLRKSEKQKRLSEAKSGGSRGSNFSPKTPTLTRQLSDLDNADESHYGSP